MIIITIKKLSYHLIWIFGLLEMITVPMVAWLPGVSSVQAKSPWQGAVVGFLGVIVLFSILNSTISKLKISMDGDILRKISLLPAALWNTLLLALIFGIQKVAGMWAIDPWIARYVFAGFVSVAGAVFITLLVYRWISQYLPFLRITITTSRHSYCFKNISVIMVALTTGAYEALALPLIMLWQNAASHVPLVAAVTGLAGGVLGSSIIVFLFNHLNSLQFMITIEKKP